MKMRGDKVKFNKFNYRKGRGGSGFSKKYIRNMEKDLFDIDAEQKKPKVKEPKVEKQPEEEQIVYECKYDVFGKLLVRLAGLVCALVCAKYLFY